MDVLDKDKIFKFLREHSGMVLSTLSPENTIDSAFVFYAVNEKLELFILTNRSTKKYANIQTNKEIAFVVTDEESLVTLQGKGEVTELASGPDSILAFNAIMEVIARKEINWPPPTAKIKNGGMAVLKIKASWSRLRDYANTKDFVTSGSES